jgi:hypothetical protein
VLEYRACCELHPPSGLQVLIGRVSGVRERSKTQDRKDTRFEQKLAKEAKAKALAFEQGRVKSSTIGNSGENELIRFPEQNSQKILNFAPLLPSVNNSVFVTLVSLLCS